ncbi:hypothetical protein HGB07_05925 [Candidatus Roizmanbacteria bacterium]|nr:hypothetical protein [Candidatus Roizmanbacteria bacterium]
MIKKFIINLVFRYYFKNSYSQPLNETQQNYLLTKMANTPGMESLPLFLEQCATNARNKYLYTNDPIFKGSIMAYTYLSDQLKKRKVSGPKKDLTADEKVGIMRGRGY